MQVRRPRLVRPSVSQLLRLAIAGTLVVAVPAVARADDSGHGDHDQAPAHLVQVVRDATRQFLDVNFATSAGYGPFLGCVNGPDHGAMGIHYVSHNLFVDGLIDATTPEALIYEPSGDLRRLVGVEFLVLAEPWLASHGGAPPVLEGQVFNLVNAPNRFNLPAFFELHVWAWRNNPQGPFVDWNNRVTCEGQPGSNGVPPDPGGDGD
jgi:hypothetical protein